jgi:uncharacterized protein YggU (UPF0235/DUF167 family)
VNIRVYAHARAGKNKIAEVGGMLHIYVTAPPLDNRANLAIRDALAKKFSCSKSSVALVRGARSSIKDFVINLK